MKKIILIIFYTAFFCYCTTSNSFFKINENFEAMQFEVFVQDNKKLELPFLNTVDIKSLKISVFLLIVLSQESLNMGGYVTLSRIQKNLSIPI